MNCISSYGPTGASPLSSLRSNDPELQWFLLRNYPNYKYIMSNRPFGTYLTTYNGYSFYLNQAGRMGNIIVVVRN